MNSNKIIQLIKNKEWARLERIAKYERTLKQDNLIRFMEG